MKYQFNGFTKGANNALCFAIETAEEMGHTYVGSEHLLVGLLKEQEGAAASLLAARNVTAEQGAELLSWDLNTLIERTLEAMKQSDNVE